ncbi:MAG TPA: polysaccharide biosynthesis tyrosine autokinase [Pyrinomonadaceae bacterium]
MSQDNRLLPLTPGSNLDRPLRELTQPDRPNNTYSLSEPTHLRDYLSVVTKRKWLILSLIVVVTSLVAIQMYRQPTVYRAESTIQIEQKTKNLLKTKEFVINAQNDPAYWGTQLALLENPRLHRKVILALDLQNNPTFVGGQARPSLFAAVRRVFSRQKAPATPAGQEGGLGVVNDAPAAPAENEKLTPEQTAKMLAYEDVLRSNLTIDPVERTNLVKIVYEHTNPELAMRVADTLAAVFIQDNIERETSGSTKSAEQLAKNIADLQVDIRQKQQEVIKFRMERGLPLGKIQGENLTASILTNTTTQMMEAEADRKKQQAAYEAALKSPDLLSVPEVLENKSVQTLRDTLSEVEEQRQGLLVKYQPEWPAVKQLDRQKEQIQLSLNKQAKDVVSAMRTRYEAAVQRENGLRQSSERARGEARGQSRSEMELGIKQQELETTQQLYNTAIQGKKEFDVTGTEMPNNITISTPARRAEIVGPPRVRNILIALLLSLAAGIGLAFLLDYLDDTLKSIEDVDRHIHLPTLALIPAPRTERRFALPARAGAAAQMGATDPTANALALIEEKRSPVAEAYRHLRTSLLLSSAGQPPKTILVTSSQPSEGKTTTAVNTAVMLAQTGAEVLILDCDLRRPRIHAHFGLGNTRGVTNYLSGDTNIGGIVQEYDKLPNLKIITSGPVPPNSAELLGSEEMRRMITLLSDNFTHIIIDSPPAISFTDASILSTMVDGVMLVVHGGRSSRAVVRRAKQQLLDVGAHIYGIVLNNVKLESSDYYYYSGYYSSYYANEDEDQAGAAAEDEYVETAKSK